MKIPIGQRVNVLPPFRNEFPSSYRLTIMMPMDSKGNRARPEEIPDLIQRGEYREQYTFSVPDWEALGLEPVYFDERYLELA